MPIVAPTQDPQVLAMRDLYRAQQAHSMFRRRQADGSLRLTLWREDDSTPVCKAVITPAGHTRVDLTEVIA